MDSLLSLIRCPITREPLQRLTTAELDGANRLIEDAAVGVKNRGGEVESESWADGLINVSRQWVYPILDHGVALIADSAIAAADFGLATDSSDGQEGHE
jgi:uncharacterized protein YbaR (Trm112 family)